MSDEIYNLSVSVCQEAAGGRRHGRIEPSDYLLAGRLNRASTICRRWDGGPAACIMAVVCRYCCKSPKLPGANFSCCKKIRPTTADRCGLNHVTGVASEFFFGR